MAVNPLIECFSRDPVHEYYQGLESSTVYTEPPFFVKSVDGGSNRSLPCLLLPKHSEDIIPTFVTSNIYFRLCLLEALTLIGVQSSEMLDV